jgi:hypothetical protein
MENEFVQNQEPAKSQPQVRPDDGTKLSDLLNRLEPVTPPISATELSPSVAETVTGDFLTAPQLAQKLNVSLKAVRKWSLSGKLMYVKMGRLVRYYWPDIEKRLLTGRLLVERS